MVINNFWFECESFIVALDLTFKAFFALDCEYPSECCNIWYFLQLAFYEIPLPSKGAALKVKTLSKEIQVVIKRNTETNEKEEQKS